MPQKIEISSRTIIFTVFFLIALRVLWLVRGVIYALFLAFIFMSALKPFVNGLERRSMPRAAAAFVVFVATLIGFGFAFVFLLPPLVDQSVIFLKDLPVLLSTTFPTFSQYLSSDSIVQFLPDITGNFVRIAGGVFSSMVFIISMFFFTFYFLLEEKFLKAFLERFLEKRQANQITEIATKVEKRMGAWV
ncbi:MAG: AI-2E family transporter, partial [Candidatus Paceibacterota bacterium]